jgi:ubiquinone/menaquinone biosynthesis C-methylase UbiE
VKPAGDRDARFERWAAKKAHYQDAGVVERYDAERFRSAHELKSTDRKWRALTAVIGARLPEGAEVLDVPAGRGRFTRRILEAGFRLTSADLSEPMLRAAREEAHLHGNFRGAVRCDAERLPFADASFDLVLSIRFLFHVPPELRAGILREFARISRRFVVVDVRHKYCYSTHTKRLRAWITGRRAPSQRASLAEIDGDIEAAGLRLSKRVWLAPLLSEKMLVVCEKRSP